MARTKYNVQEQPKPTGDGLDVARLASDDLLNHQSYGFDAAYNNAITLARWILFAWSDGKNSSGEDVYQDIEKRIQAGEKKYGSRLKTNNGRDALRDAYEESLDLIVYLKQAHLEGRV